MQVWLTACGKTASIASGKPRQAVGADEQDVLDAAVAELGQHARPEAGAFGLLDPEAQAVALTVEGDPDRDVDGLLTDDLLVADRDLERVQVDDHVQLLERPALPQPHVVLDRCGHLTDQSVRDVDAVELTQVPLDLAGRHPARVQGEDLLVEAVERTSVLGHDPRLEARVAIPRQLDRHRPIDRPQRLRARAVAPVRLPLRRPSPRRVAEVLLELGAGGTLDQPLAQPVDQPIRAGQLLRPLVLTRAADRSARPGSLCVRPSSGLLPGRPTDSLLTRPRRDRPEPVGRTSQIHRNPRTTDRRALRAADPVQPVLGHPDRDRRQLRHLTPRRLDRIDALHLGELARARPALLGPVLDQLVNPLGRK